MQIGCHTLLPFIEIERFNAARWPACSRICADNINPLPSLFKLAQKGIHLCLIGHVYVAGNQRRICLLHCGKLVAIHIADRDICAVGEECFGNGAPDAGGSGGHKDTLCHDLLPQCCWFLARTHRAQPFGGAIME